jgi:hypothetical protein
MIPQKTILLSGCQGPPPPTYTHQKPWLVSWLPSQSPEWSLAADNLPPRTEFLCGGFLGGKGSRDYGSWVALWPATCKLEAHRGYWWAPVPTQRPENLLAGQRLSPGPSSPFCLFVLLWFQQPHPAWVRWSSLLSLLIQMLVLQTLAQIHPEIKDVDTLKLSLLVNSAPLHNLKPYLSPNKDNMVIILPTITTLVPLIHGFTCFFLKFILVK